VQISHITAVDTLTVGPFLENTHLLRLADRGRTIVVDPGDEVERIIAHLEREHLEPVAIVNTHAHLDHIGAVEPLKRRFKIPFYLHPADLPILREAPAHAQFFGVPVPMVPEVDFDLADGMVLDLADLSLRVLHTPGHTPGGVSLLVFGRVFAGDTLFAGSVGRTDLPGGDWGTLLASLTRKLLDLPDQTIVHSGHGPDTSIGRERHSNPFLIDSGSCP
jgi:glyoxylase-like metal-dependent hydrolase (beta-lactamase superfamily II)